MLYLVAAWINFYAFYLCAISMQSKLGKIQQAYSQKEYKQNELT